MKSAPQTGVSRFLRTCQLEILKTRTDLKRHDSIVQSWYQTCALHCFHDRQLNADQNINWLESRKSRTMPGCWTPHSSAPGSTVMNLQSPRLYIIGTRPIFARLNDYSLSVLCVLARCSVNENHLPTDLLLSSLYPGI